MPRIKVHQAGIGASFAIAAVLAVLVLAGVSVIAFNKTGSKAAITAPSTAPSSTPKQPAPISAKPAEPNAKKPYLLAVSEWDVSLPLPESLKDAYYVPAIGASTRDDGKPSMMYLGIRSLDTKSDCSATNANLNGSTAFAAIISVSPDATDPISGNLLTKQYPNGITIGKYYYAYEKLGGTKCKPDNRDLQAIHAEFGNAAKNTTKLKASN